MPESFFTHSSRDSQPDLTTLETAINYPLSPAGIMLTNIIFEGLEREEDTNRLIEQIVQQFIEKQRQTDLELMKEQQEAARRQEAILKQNAELIEKELQKHLEDLKNAGAKELHNEADKLTAKVEELREKIKVLEDKLTELKMEREALTTKWKAIHDKKLDAFKTALDLTDLSADDKTRLTKAYTPSTTVAPHIAVKARLDRNTSLGIPDSLATRKSDAKLDIDARSLMAQLRFVVPEIPAELTETVKTAAGPKGKSVKATVGVEANRELRKKELADLKNTGRGSLQLRLAVSTRANNAYKAGASELFNDAEANYLQLCQHVVVTTDTESQLEQNRSQLNAAENALDAIQLQIKKKCGIAGPRPPGGNRSTYGN